MFRATFPPVIALGLVAGISANGARAADYLRGSYAGETAPRQVVQQDWAGVYGGGFAGLSSVNNTPGSLRAPTIPNAGFGGIAGVSALYPGASVLPSIDKRGMSYGGFAGINYLWDDVVLGFEADYSHSSIKADTRVGPTVRASFPGPGGYTLTVTESGKARPTDWGTLRARVGYSAGMFMPFITLGMAMGNVQTRTSTTWAYTDTQTPSPAGGGTLSGSKDGLMFGAAFGAGVEAQIVPNTFLRAEWQTVQFAHSNGRPEVSIHTGRIGGGVKF